jgi:hypothetical protein
VEDLQAEEVIAEGLQVVEVQEVVIADNLSINSI